MSRIFSLVILILLFNGAYNCADAKNPVKVEKKLNKLYLKSNFNKLEKKALKYKLKDGSLESPDYFLSRLELDQSQRIAPKPNKKQWSHIRKSLKYASALKSEKYKQWQDSLGMLTKQYIESWNGMEQKHTHAATNEYNRYIAKLEGIEYKVSIGNSANTNKHSTGKNSKIRESIIKAAEKQLGVPYKYGGETPGDGFDCSGFVKYVYAQVGIELPHNSHMQSQLEGETLSIKDAKPGDIIIFGSKHSKGWRTQHSGIVYGFKDGKILVIHAPSRGVTIDGNNPSWESYWKSRVLFIKRIPELEE